MSPAPPPPHTHTHHHHTHTTTTTTTTTTPHTQPPQAFGEVRSLYTAAKARGFVVVSYHDTRAATLAKHTLTGQALGSQQLDVHFSLPKDDREAAQVGGRLGRLVGRGGVR